MNPPCPYCGRRHRGDPIIKAIQCKYRWQNRELYAIMKAEKTLMRLEDEQELYPDWRWPSKGECQK